MKHRILVNNTLEDSIEAETPLQACAKYVETHIPNGRVVRIHGGHLINFDVAVLKTAEYTVEARAVPEVVV